MKSVEAFESINILKNKFEEIRNNILTIEKGKRTEGLSADAGPVKRFEYVRPASTSKIRDDRRVQSFIEENPLDIISALKKQVYDLQETNFRQASTIENLKNENSQLKAKLEEKVLIEKCANKSRPQSCLRSESSSPKKARVVFAKELTKVQYIPSHSQEFVSPSEMFDYENQIIPKKVPEVKIQNFDYNTPPRIKPEERSLRAYMEEKRHQMNKLTSMSFDSDIPNYFRERSMMIAKKLIKD